MLLYADIFCLGMVISKKSHRRASLWASLGCEDEAFKHPYMCLSYKVAEGRCVDGLWRGASSPFSLFSSAGLSPLWLEEMMNILQERAC